MLAFYPLLLHDNAHAVMQVSDNHHHSVRQIQKIKHPACKLSKLHTQRSQKALEETKICEQPLSIMVAAYRTYYSGQYSCQIAHYIVKIAVMNTR